MNNKTPMQWMNFDKWTPATAYRTGMDSWVLQNHTREDMHMVFQ